MLSFFYSSLFILECLNLQSPSLEQGMRMEAFRNRLFHLPAVCRFSGLCAAIQVKKQLGIKAQVYELSADVGGTWHDNTYPGCAW